MGDVVTAGKWYALSPDSTPFLFVHVEYGAGARHAQIRGVVVRRDGVVQVSVRTASQARRMREVPAPEGEAYREAERRGRECG